MATSGFFDKVREQSLVKSKIATKYFGAWATVISRQGTNRLLGARRMAYVDLMAGAGRYKDGTKSTPIKILEVAIVDAQLRSSLVTIFNDHDERHLRSLREEIALVPGLESLAYQPVITDYEVDETLAKFLESTTLVPSFVFIDPCGYSGLSLRLIDSVLKDWGSDCLFFFNYNRVNMGIDNPLVADHIGSLFGAERAKLLTNELTHASPQIREERILEELKKALGYGAGRFVHTFAFKNLKGTRTTHYLVFVSKNQTAYEIMKDISGRESTSHPQGVPSHIYNPAERAIGTLFDLSHPLDDLMESLLVEFRGQTLAAKDVFKSHNVGKPYVLQNYRDALKALEARGKVKAQPDVLNRKKGTMPDWVNITFPVQEEGGRNGPQDGH